MKAVLLSFLYEPELGGGAAAVVNQLAHSLIQKSNSVVVITTWNGRYIKRENIDGIKIFRIPPMNLYWVGAKDKQHLLKKVFWQVFDIWNPHVFRVVRQILIKEKPEYIHSIKLRGLSPSIWSAAASAGIKKIIHTCQDYEIISPEGQLRTRIGKLAERGSALLFPYQALRRHVSRHVCAVTAPSNFVLRKHTNLGFFPSSHSEVISNSHGYTSSQIEKHRAPFCRSFPGPLKLLYLGRLEPEKGVNVAVKSIAGLSGVELNIAGWGSLEQKIAGEGNIHLLGPLFGEKKEAAIVECDALLVPSTWPESFGIVAAEAFAFGKPVIASNIGGLPEVVQDGVTGWLVEPGNVEAWKSKINQLVCIKDDLAQMADACFLRANEYTIEKIHTQFETLYKS